ncbi:hypothetical protein K438DRAFT_1752547 [Mycena galopus ATCC 62051]|nr:hypothetical protein K438DRAFT_1752547 [Mycena galopus ATCC 62051]
MSHIGSSDRQIHQWIQFKHQPAPKQRKRRPPDDAAGHPLPPARPVMSPQTQDYVVSYTDYFIYTNLYSEPVDPQITPAPLGVGDIAAYCLSQAFIYGQSQIHNVVGDSMASIFAAESTKVPMTTLWVPPVLSKQHTYGESSNLQGRTFVAVASILIVVFVQLKNRKIPGQHADFDPNDPLSLILRLRRRGGISDTFRGLAEGDIKEGGLKKVTFGPISDKDGFVEVVGIVRLGLIEIFTGLATSPLTVFAF